MKTFYLLALIGIILASVLPSVSFAASDCEHTCCQKFAGRWDDDFDDCKSAKDGFDTCVSDCEAAVWANRPQGPDTTGGTHYSCKYPAILATLVVGVLLMERRK